MSQKKCAGNRTTEPEGPDPQADLRYRAAPAVVRLPQRETHLRPVGDRLHGSTILAASTLSPDLRRRSATSTRATPRKKWVCGSGKRRWRKTSSGWCSTGTGSSTTAGSRPWRTAPANPGWYSENETHTFTRGRGGRLEKSRSGRAGFEDRVVHISRVAKVVKGGRASPSARSSWSGTPTGTSGRVSGRRTRFPTRSARRCRTPSGR